MLFIRCISCTAQLDYLYSDGKRYNSAESSRYAREMTWRMSQVATGWESAIVPDAETRHLRIVSNVLESRSEGHIPFRAAGIHSKWTRFLRTQRQCINIYGYGGAQRSSDDGVFKHVSHQSPGSCTAVLRCPSSLHALTKHHTRVRGCTFDRSIPGACIVRTIYGTVGLSKAPCFPTQGNDYIQN